MAEPVRLDPPALSSVSTAGVSANPGVDTDVSPDSASVRSPTQVAVGRLITPDVLRLRDDLIGIDPQLGPGVLDGWATVLFTRMCGALEEALHGELTAWRMVHLPFGGATPGVDEHFVDRVAEDDGRWLAERYPEGERLRRVLARNWAEAARELHTRLVADRPRVAEAFGIGEQARPMSVTAGAGDSHRGGRSVVCMEFDDGRRLVYKPRSVRPERVLTTLLTRVAEGSGDMNWPAVGTIERDGYGWMEFVDHVPANDRAGVARFYRRAGILLAVTHAIGMNDLHMENLIARGDEPIVIDAETLMPASILGRPGDGLDPVVGDQAQTVLDTGLLPRWLPVYRQRTDLDHPAVLQLGGLGPVHHTRLPALTWTTTTGGRVERSVRTVLSPPGLNLPVLDGLVQEPEPFRAEVLAGFDDGVRSLRTQAEALGLPAAPLSELWATPVRVVARNTSAYASALRAATRRTALRNGEVRAAVLRERLGQVAASAGEALRSAESAALRDGDVPLFQAHPGEAVARSGDRGTLGDDGVVALRQSPAAASRHGFQTVADSSDDSHLRRQRGLISASLATPYPLPHAGTESEARRRRRSPDQATGAAATDVVSVSQRRHDSLDRVVDWPSVASVRAAQLADHIDISAIRRDGRIGWLAVTRDVGTGRATAGPAGWGLAGGSLGVALFLANAGQVLGSTRWTRTVDLTLHTAVDMARWSMGPDAPHDGSAIDLGRDTGWGGLTWALAELADLLGRPDLASIAAELSSKALRRTGGALGRLDHDGGAAGLIVGLTRLARTAARDAAVASLDELSAMVSDHLRSNAFGREEASGRWPARDASVVQLTESLVRASQVAGTALTHDAASNALARSATRIADRRVDPTIADARPQRWSREDGLRFGVAGQVQSTDVRSRARADGLARLNKDPAHLRLVGEGVPTWLVPGLADGLAGVGTTWLLVLDSTGFRPPWGGDHVQAMSDPSS